MSDPKYKIGDIIHAPFYASKVKIVQIIESPTYGMIYVMQFLMDNGMGVRVGAVYESMVKYIDYFDGLYCQEETETLKFKEQMEELLGD